MVEGYQLSKEKFSKLNSKVIALFETFGKREMILSDNSLDNKGIFEFLK